MSALPSACSHQKGSLSVARPGGNCLTHVLLALLAVAPWGVLRAAYECAIPAASSCLQRRMPLLRQAMARLPEGWVQLQRVRIYSCRVTFVWPPTHSLELRSPPGFCNWQLAWQWRRKPYS
jgi:hypothetical protein